MFPHRRVFETANTVLRPRRILEADPQRKVFVADYSEEKSF